MLINKNLKITQNLKHFLRDEEGKISKSGIIKAGMLFSALSFFATKNDAGAQACSPCGVDPVDCSMNCNCATVNCDCHTNTGSDCFVNYFGKSNNTGFHSSSNCNCHTNSNCDCKSTDCNCNCDCDCDCVPCYGDA